MSLLRCERRPAWRNVFRSSPFVVCHSVVPEREDSFADTFRGVVIQEGVAVDRFPQTTLKTRS